MKKYLVYVFIVFFLAACSTKEVELVNVEKKDKIEKKDTRNEKQINEFNNELESDFDSSLQNNQEHILEENFLTKTKESMQITLIYPSKILSRYGNSAFATLNAYFLYNDMNFKIKVIDSINQNEESIKSAFDELKKSSIKNAIVLMTKESMDVINTLDGLENHKLYFPLINKYELENPKDDFIFGSISYYDHLVKLNEISTENRYMFYEKNYVGKLLNSYYETLPYLNNKTIEVQRRNNNFKSLINNKNMNNKSIFLNTSIVKTSIILSQLTVYDIEAKNILSTQLNYNPILIDLTQESDRKRFIVSNSIEEVDKKLIDIAFNLGANLKFNWVDYSTLVGISYLHNNNLNYLVKNKIIENQVLYKVKLFKATKSGFKELSNNSL